MKAEQYAYKGGYIHLSPTKDGVKYKATHHGEKLSGIADTKTTGRQMCEDFITLGKKHNPKIKHVYLVTTPSDGFFGAWYTRKEAEQGMRNMTFIQQKTYRSPYIKEVPAPSILESHELDYNYDSQQEYNETYLIAENPEQAIKFLKTKESGIDKFIVSLDSEELIYLVQWWRKDI